MDAIKRQSVAQLREMRKSEDGKAGGIIGALYDEGTFAELGTFIKNGDGNFEPVITGYGAVGERLVYTFIEDGSREKGAFGEGAAKKIVSLLDLAKMNGAPAVGVFDSAGAKITEGVNALGAYGSIMRKLSKVKGFIPLIAVINGICSGAMAVAARMFDIVITVKDTEGIFVNPPSLTGGKGDDPALTGLSDIAADNIDDAIDMVKKLLELLPSGSWGAYIEPQDDPNRRTPELETAGSAKELITIIADDGIFNELGGFNTPEMSTGFIRMNGNGIGVVANNPAVLNGALTPSAASKAARFIKLCAGLGIPLLTLVNTAGYDYNRASENVPYASALASLTETYTSSGCARVTLVSGQAYGSAFTIMGSKSLGTDIVFALEGAEIGIMPPDSAVQFLYGDRINKSADPEAERASLLAEYKRDNSPLEAARGGDIDDILTYEETRQRLISAFEMLIFKL
ncbi:MAG: carboxyl transferase domain-containing protein [Eubacteriales bacterium]|nr:carboxyl transferase domain-containing protein [Eubacteriales bacterium]